jgi:hypothetical protein
MRLWLLTGKAGLHWQAFLVQFAKKKKRSAGFFLQQALIFGFITQGMCKIPTI